jgi:uncharacterized protein (TIGR04255 family)
MARIRLLKNAPVTEAVVDLRVRFQKAPSDAQFEQFSAAVQGDYPQSERRQSLNFTLDLEKGPSVETTGLDGYVLKSADGLQIAQCKPAGFSFSRLKPYKDWESTVAEARRLWRLYVELLQPERVLRVSTRFINRIELSEPVPFDLDEYFTIIPKIPQGAPDKLGTFSSNLSIPDIAPKTLGIVRCSLAGPAVPGNIPVVLDFDIIRDCDCAGTDEEKIWSEINELRPIKNMLFFGSITEKTAERFE